MDKKDNISKRAGLLFALPAAIYMLVFVGYPMIQNLILSLKDVDVYTFTDSSKQKFIGFANYIELFKGNDAVMPAAIKNTLGLSSILCKFLFSGG